MSRPKNSDFSRAGEVLQNLFERIVPEETRRSAQVFRGWEEVAGSETAMHVIPVDIRNHALILECDHPGWSQRMRMRQENILHVLSEKYPELEIRTLKISISDGKSPRIPEYLAASLGPDPKYAVDASDALMEKKTRKHDERSDPEQDKAFFDLMEKMRRRSDP